MSTSPPLHHRSRYSTLHATPSPAPQLTFDLLLLALSKSLFHPFIACLLPLCLRALAAPYTSTSFILTCSFAAAVCLYHVLALVNQRIAYGTPRKINWEHEVVVITGGCGGLGGCIAEIYGMRGVSVAVLDIAVSTGDHGKEKEGLLFYRCDVGNEKEIESVWDLITKELGAPTVLINNAAVTASGPLVHMNAQRLENVFRVNTFSHFYANNIFLRHLAKRRKGGTIVTISSVLGHLGAANLSTYTASKAALLAYHTSLTAELGASASQIKTILVAPGQLDTQLFSNIKVEGWLQNFLGPVVGAGELAMKIVEMVDRGDGGEIRMPAIARWIAVVAVLPMGLQKWLRGWVGIDVAMGDIVGFETNHEIGDEREKSSPDKRKDSNEAEDHDSINSPDESE